MCVCVYSFQTNYRYKKNPTNGSGIMISVPETLPPFLLSSKSISHEVSVVKLVIFLLLIPSDVPREVKCL